METGGPARRPALRTLSAPGAFVREPAAPSAAGRGAGAGRSAGGTDPRR